MKNESESFLDTQTLLAILMMGVVFFGWNAYMQNKYPDANKKAAATASKTATVQTPVTGSTPANATASTPEAPLQSASLEEKVVHYSSATMSFDISSRGMGIKAVQLLKYTNREGNHVDLGRSDGRYLALETRLKDRSEPLNFTIEQVNANVFIGRAQFGGLQITKTIEINPEQYVLDCKVAVAGTDDRFIGLATVLTEDVEPVLSATSPLPQHQKQEFFVDTAESKDREVFGKGNTDKSWSRVKLASIGSQFFTQAVLDKSAVMPDAKAHLDRAGKTSDLWLLYPVLSKSDSFALDYRAFVGPKSLSLLRQVDEELVRVVDFGVFSWIGRHILDLMRAFYGLVGNWGVAIIFLTLVFRLLVLPVNIYSYKSMRAMQAIQPQLQALKERYKNDQAKQQQETMALMRTHKVNPVGGCLPILLQIPLFYALYQVLGNSIELYQAPFGLWIHDLSLKDPYYILPVLMGLTMFVQQKITPNAMDPAQAKVLLMMPLIFTFFMVSLPSGLTLYMLVGAAFSVVQQSYFMKQSKTLSAVTK